MGLEAEITTLHFIVETPLVFLMIWLEALTFTLQVSGICFLNPARMLWKDNYMIYLFFKSNSSYASVSGN